MPLKDDSNQDAAKTSKIVKKVRAAIQETKEQAKKRIRVRLIPIWMRIVIVLLLVVFSLTVGTIVGYSVIGTGKPIDALKQSTWTHIIDLINKE